MQRADAIKCLAIASLVAAPFLACSSSSGGGVGPSSDAGGSGDVSALDAPASPDGSTTQDASDASSASDAERDGFVGICGLRSDAGGACNVITMHANAPIVTPQIVAVLPTIPTPGGVIPDGAYVLTSEQKTSGPVVQKQNTQLLVGTCFDSLTITGGSVESRSGGTTSTSAGTLTVNATCPVVASAAGTYSITNVGNKTILTTLAAGATYRTYELQ